MTMFSLLLLFGLAAAPAPARAETVAVSGMLDHYKVAWERGDAAALAALYAADAELSDTQAIAQGRPAIRALYQASFDAGFAGSRVETRIEATRTIAAGVLYGRGVSRISLKPAGAGAPVQSYCGRFFAVMRRGGDGWRIATFNEVALDCGKAFP